MAAPRGVRPHVQAQHNHTHTHTRGRNPLVHLTIPRVSSLVSPTQSTALGHADRADTC
jgi:hypothetical protein